MSPVPRLCFDDERRLLTISHRFDRVAHQVEQHLLNLDLVYVGGMGVGIETRGEGDTPPFEPDQG
jgi:hypothetical protein